MLCVYQICIGITAVEWKMYNSCLEINRRMNSMNINETSVYSKFLCRKKQVRLPIVPDDSNHSHGVESRLVYLSNFIVIDQIFLYYTKSLFLDVIVERLSIFKIGHPDDFRPLATRKVKHLSESDFIFIVEACRLR